MEEAPEKGKELSHSAHDDGMNEWMNEWMNAVKSKLYGEIIVKLFYF